MLPPEYRTRLAMWLVAHENISKKDSCNDFATKVGFVVPVKPSRIKILSTCCLLSIAQD